VVGTSEGALEGPALGATLVGFIVGSNEGAPEGSSLGIVVGD